MKRTLEGYNHVVRVDVEDPIVMRVLVWQEEEGGWIIERPGYRGERKFIHKVERTYMYRLI